jgi:hypothetical protein
MSQLLSSIKKNFSLDNLPNISVEVFFSSSNWSGINNNIFETQPVKNAEILSVEKFFTSCNWSGKILRISDYNQLKTLSLTLPVGEFLSNINWHKPPLIANIPEKISTLEPNITKKDNFSLNDLSDLF